LFIAHDLAAVAHMSQQVAVMYLGKIVEIGDAAEISMDPKHPYTQALFAAALPAHPDEARDEIVVAGEVPSPIAPPPGCHFHPRCPHAMPRCSSEPPKLMSVGGRMIACHPYGGGSAPDTASIRWRASARGGRSQGEAGLRHRSHGERGPRAVSRTGDGADRVGSDHARVRCLDRTVVSGSRRDGRARHALRVLLRAARRA